MSKENYSGIKFMTGVNNIMSVLMIIGGVFASISSSIAAGALGGDSAFFALIGGFLATIFCTLMFRSSIEMMTAMREIAINTRRSL